MTDTMDRLRNAGDAGREHIRGALDRNDWRLKDANPGQHGLVKVLLGQLKAHNPEVWMVAHAWYNDHAESMNRGQVSEVITRLRAQLAQPAAVVVTVPVPVRENSPWIEWRKLAAELVEFGGSTGARFAVDTEDGAVNTVAFWWIVPNDGPHGKRYFLRQVIGGQGAVRVRMSPEAMITIARKIHAAGPKEALIRYGQEIGECGHCGRSLTNDESRAVGVGPVCRAKKGW